MFERFTDRARAVVVRAQDEARMLNHNYIGTEHLLLGLLDENGGAAARVLESLGIDAARVRIQIEEIIGSGEQTPSGHIPFTPRAKKVMELALREALQLKHNYISTEHILLGLIREGEGVAAQVLVALGVELKQVRTAVVDQLEGGVTTVDPAPSRSEAAKQALSEAQQLAGGAPLGSHHLLAALAGADGSMAARVLAELGVHPEAIAEKMGELDPDDTTDATPELTAASKMELRVEGDEVHVVLRDAASVRLARAVTEDGKLEAQGPLAGAFLQIWRTVNTTLDTVHRSMHADEHADEGDSASTLLRRALRGRRRRRRRS
ncbi:MAG: Clp protease [Actinophytocola sp.]|nr:Clp protease [Actinophytocola sp.]